MGAAIASAKVSRALKLEKPLHALLALADSASVGADPAKAAAALDGVTAAAVKKAAAAALKSGMSMASVGNIAEVRACVCRDEARACLLFVMTSEPSVNRFGVLLFLLCFSSSAGL